MADIPAIIVKSMPGQNNNAAPKFDGRLASLSLFLDDIEQLANDCSLTPKQKIEWTIRYAPNEEHELWSMLESAKTDNWTQYKTELYDLYPGSNGERKYSITSLKTLVEKQAANAIRDAEDFGVYRHPFMMITAFLKSKQCLTDREISTYFMEGLDSKFRAKIKGQLKAEEPKHHIDNPFTLSQISAAALLVLSCDHSGRAKSGFQGPAIKQEILDPAPRFSKGKFQPQRISFRNSQTIEYPASFLGDTKDIILSKL